MNLNSINEPEFRLANKNRCPYSWCNPGPCIRFDGAVSATPTAVEVRHQYVGNGQGNCQNRRHNEQVTHWPDAGKVDA